MRASKGVFVLAAVVGSAACGHGRPVDTLLPLRRVVVYRNGVGYFERAGHVDRDHVEFRVRDSEVGDFLGTLAVMESGGSSVRSAAFPLPGNASGANAATQPGGRRDVRLALDGRGHDLVVGYTVETPIWRPSYRLVIARGHVQVQSWGIVQNTSGEDWTDVRLSLVAGAPVSFRSELAVPVIPERPLVTDRGSVIDAVPQGDTTLAQDAPAAQPPPPPMVMQAAAPTPSMGPTTGAGRGAMAMRRPASTRTRGAMPMAAAEQPAYDYEASGGVSNMAAPGDAVSAPRSTIALAALAVQGGATRFDLPNTVTVPDASATMVLLGSRDVPGEAMYVFSPDPGVGDSNSHPFHVVRFENRTGAQLERGPLAIFENEAYLGQGLLDPLPDAATATVPFALERGIAVDSSDTASIENARLVRIQHDQLTIERDRVQRVTYRVRSGLGESVQLRIRQSLGGGAQLMDPPTGTERGEGTALVPVTVAARSSTELVVRMRYPFAQTTTWQDPAVIEVLGNYLRDGHPTDAVAATLRSALELRSGIADLERELATVQQRKNDLEGSADETRRNLEAVRRIATAADLRTQLTARLARTSTELEELTRHGVELDTQLGEKRVRLAELVRTLDLDVTVPTPAATRH